MSPWNLLSNTFLEDAVSAYPPVPIRGSWLGLRIIALRLHVKWPYHSGSLKLDLKAPVCQPSCGDVRCPTAGRAHHTAPKGLLNQKTLFFFFFLAVLGIPCGAWALEHVGFFGVAHGLSCPTARGTLVPHLEIEHAFSALEGRFLTTGTPGKSPRRYNSAKVISVFLAPPIE